MDEEDIIHKLRKHLATKFTRYRSRFLVFGSSPSYFILLTLPWTNLRKSEICRFDVYNCFLKIWGDLGFWINITIKFIMLPNAHVSSNVEEDWTCISDEQTYETSQIIPSLDTESDWV